MTTEEILSRIQKIKDASGDDESQHYQEDELRSRFIKYITTLESNPLRDRAVLVMSTKDIDFDRWCG